MPYESSGAASDVTLAVFGLRIIPRRKSDSLEKTPARAQSHGRLRTRPPPSPTSNGSPEVDRAGAIPQRRRAQENRAGHENPRSTAALRPWDRCRVREVWAAAPGCVEFNNILTLRRSARCCHITGTAWIKALGRRESQLEGVGAPRRHETLSVRYSDTHAAAIRAGSAKPETHARFSQPMAQPALGRSRARPIERRRNFSVRQRLSAMRVPRGRGARPAGRLAWLSSSAASEGVESLIFPAKPAHCSARGRVFFAGIARVRADGLD